MKSYLKNLDYYKYDVDNTFVCYFTNFLIAFNSIILYKKSKKKTKKIEKDYFRLYFLFQSKLHLSSGYHHLYTSRYEPNIYNIKYINSNDINKEAKIVVINTWILVYSFTSLARHYIILSMVLKFVNNNLYRDLLKISSLCIYILYVYNILRLYYK